MRNGGTLSFLVGIVLAGCVLNTRSNRSFLSLFVEDSPSILCKQCEDSSSSSSNRRRPKLADGCYHVFLDVGANIGVHGRFLMEPDKYPVAMKAHSMFNPEFGKDRDNRLFCIFAFEPNPSHQPRLHSLQKAYAAMGWRYHVMPMGVSDESGNLTFYRMNDGGQQEWGFNAVRKINMRGQAGVPVTVPIVRLATWIEQEIHDRTLPDLVALGYNNSLSSSIHPSNSETDITSSSGGKVLIPPKVVMKLDIEGLEMKVIPDLLLSGVFCSKLNLVFGESHFMSGFYPMTLHENGLVLRSRDEGIQYIQGLMKVMTAAQNCKTEWKREDDETYLHDGIPFPVPSVAAKATTTNISVVVGA